MSEHTAEKEYPSAGFSITVRLKIPNKVGMFAEIVRYLATSGASLAEVHLVSSDVFFNIRDITINCGSENHSKKIIAGFEGRQDIQLISWHDDTFELHRGGKIVIDVREEIFNSDQLSRAYTPGVARVCTAIHQNPALASEYTIKKNSVAVITDGTAVLGLGDIGPEASLPVMEGKAVLFKQFGNVDAYPIALKTKDVEEIIRTIVAISPVFGGINLEDISAPRCFEIEERLQQELDIPVFHDDQHGTAVVVLAGLFNAMKIVEKKLGDLKVVVNGFGAGGVACTRLMLDAGVKNIIPCDTQGIVYRGRGKGMNPVKDQVVAVTNPDNLQGSLADAMRGADVFVGVSGPGLLTREMVASMNKDSIVFALANPVPEILPEEIKDLARIIATGRSDYPNQVNNVLCFPGIFRGALDIGAKSITPAMKIGAAHAIAECVSDSVLDEQHIIPGVFDPNVPIRVAERTRQAVNI